MKRLVCVFAFLAANFFASCASDGPTGQEVGEQLSRGVRGEGQLTPDIDRTNDPFVKPRGGRAGAPEGSG